VGTRERVSSAGALSYTSPRPLASSSPRLLASMLRSILAVLVICGCEAGGPDADIPKTPLLHPQATTIPQQNAIRIEWDVSAEEDLAGYKVYRSTSPEEKDSQIIATVSEKDGYYEDTEVSIGVRYYYRISAFDDSGNESDKSDTVDYTLLEKPALIEPADQAVVKTTMPTFVWLGVSGASAYTVHVYSRAADGTTWEEIWHSEKIYPYQDLRKTYNDDNLALKPLERGMTYKWRVDSSGGQSTGSQSRWRYFTVIGDQ